MDEISNTRSAMAAAEQAVSRALFFGTPAQQLDAIMAHYWNAGSCERDALVAVLASRLCLRRPAISVPTPSSVQTGAAA